ncbi:MAG: hypothetical protein DSY53_04430 [Persephonella sp.]|nr:MAG: hypothetical protein DSY53_04430 [Persephonella sp.]
MEKKFLALALVIFIGIYNLSYGKEKLNLNKDFSRTKLLILTKGLYEDGFYSLAYHKAKKYLQTYPEDEKNREALIKIMLYSAIKSRSDDLIFDFINFINNLDISDDFKDKIYATVIKESIKNDDKLKQILEKIIPFVKDKELKKRFLTALINIYFEEKNYKKIISFDNIPKEVFIYKIIALYKLGMYKELIKETENLKNIPKEFVESVNYYRALSFYKLGKINKAVNYFESLKNKNPEILKLLVSYYLRKNNIPKVKKYAYELSKYKDYYDFTYYILGYLEDIQGNYDKAYQYYSISSKYNTKYGIMAKKRIKELKKSGILRTYYSVRIALSSSKANADEFIKRKKLKNCFIKPYKNFYGIYCGKFKTFKSAQKYLELLISKGFTDALIEELAELKK